MTADELAARLYAEQGYLVINTVTTRNPGDIKRIAGPLGMIATPVRVLGSATFDEFERQRRLQEAWGFPRHPETYRYFYRVEAAD